MNDEWIPTEPQQPQAVAAALPRNGQARLARIGLLGIAAAALVAAAILVVGATATPAGTLAADTSAGNGGPVGGMNAMGGPGGRDMGGPGHRIGGGITITAISGSNLSLKTDDGWARTITVDSGTTYSKSGATISLGDLAVGDHVVFRQTHETDGSWTIDSVTVVLPRLGGTVTAVSGSTITVEQRDGTTATINVSGATTFEVNGSSGALSDIETGMVVMAEGTLASDGSLAATEVHAGDPGAFRGGHGRFGPGHDWDGDAPNPGATTAPATGNSAS